jgi:hypothetical protein
MNRPDFGVLFRRPTFPVVGFAYDRLISALDLKMLALILVRFGSSSGEDKRQTNGLDGNRVLVFVRTACVVSRIYGQAMDKAADY